MPLSSAPFYLPNLIAATAASVAIVAGSIGPWASAPILELGGVDFDQWGVVTLVIGAAAAVALFVQLNWGRTDFSLRWAVPVMWAVLVAGVGCLAIAVVNIVTVFAVREQLELGPALQVGWGLWLVAISSAVLCVTAPIVAAQVGKAAQGEAKALPEPWLGTWRWAAIIASAVVLLTAMASAYKPLTVSLEAGDTTQTATQTVTASPCRAASAFSLSGTAAG